MPEKQDIQSLFRFQELQRLLPLEKNVRFMNLWNKVPLEKKKKDHLEAMQSWLNGFVCFENMACKALTEEDRRSVEEEKQLFYKKIGLDEETLKDIVKHGIDFFLRFYHASTVEEFESIMEERNSVLKDKEIILMRALNSYIIEKNRDYPLQLVTSIC